MRIQHGKDCPEGAELSGRYLCQDTYEFFMTLHDTLNDENHFEARVGTSPKVVGTGT